MSKAKKCCACGVPSRINNDHREGALWTCPKCWTTWRHVCVVGSRCCWHVLVVFTTRRLDQAQVKAMRSLVREKGHADPTYLHTADSTWRFLLERGWVEQQGEEYAITDLGHEALAKHHAAPAAGGPAT